MIDHKPICVLCKLKGSHEKHGTILIDQAYTEAKALCLDIENNVDQKKKYLKQNLAKLNESVKILETHAKEQEAAILDAYKKALKQLTADFDQRFNLLQSDIVEISRQIFEIDHM